MATFDVSGISAIHSGLRARTRQGSGNPLRHCPVKPMNYLGAHQRLKHLRGRASTYVCEQCYEAFAEQWSYNGNSEFEQTGTRIVHGPNGQRWTTTVAWSPLVWDYTPRCRPCHAQYDIEQRRAKK